ncbi:MAG: amidohydrolase family protein [Thermomicrobiales bacterium]
MIVDLHSHYFPLDAARAAGSPVQVIEQPDGVFRFAFGGQTMTLPAALFDLNRQLADLHRQGLTRRVLQPPPFSILYELPPDQGVAWSRGLNDGIAAAARAHPDAFIGFATVPLQDVAAAMTELDRAARDLGLRGVEILTNINGVGLDAPALDPFWAAMERLDLPMLIHPHHVAGAERMDGYYLRNMIGNPHETGLAGARLLFGGVLERFPRLRIILSHGGGSLAHLSGRLRHGYAVRPEARERAADPLAHLNRLFFDTIVFDPRILRHLVAIVGVSQVVLGSDYPFDMAEDAPVPFVRQAGLAAADAEAILNAADRILPGSAMPDTTTGVV